MSLSKLADTFQGVKVLVIGDVMLDRYWWGDVTRISPEAPVPVVRMKSASLAAGGAANVAANIAGLGASASLLGYVGEDAEGTHLTDIVAANGVDISLIVRSADRPTTVKTRVVAHGQQVARVDLEITEPLSAESEAMVIEAFRSSVQKFDSVAVSDYAKGLLTPTMLREVTETCARISKPVIIDPKGKDYSKYRGATVLTPNRREAAEACNLDDTGKPLVEVAGKRLIDELKIDALLITEGDEGMTLFRRGEASVHLPATAREVYDVTGAGDTVLASIAAALGSGLDIVTAARFANLAAGSAVERVGTTIVTMDMLEENNSLEELLSKENE